MSEGFDTKVHHKNPKTGQLEKVTPYSYHVGPEGTFYKRRGVRYRVNGEQIDPNEKPIPLASERKASNEALNVQLQKQIQDLTRREQALIVKEEAMRVAESQIESAEPAPISPVIKEVVAANQESAQTEKTQEELKNSLIPEGAPPVITNPLSALANQAAS